MAGEHRFGGVGPKIAALLGRAEAAGALEELEACERLGVSPSAFRGRPQVTTYLYDEQGRLVRSVTASQWGHEDRALMLALRAHRRTECPRCGNPKATAWHVDNDGHWEAKAEYICHPCSVRAGDDVKFTVVVDTRDYAADPLHGSYTDFAAVDAAAGAAAPQVAGPAPAGEVALGG